MRLEIDDCPASLNTVLNMHWSQRMQYKKVWESYMWLWTPRDRVALQKLHDTKTKLRIRVTLHHARMYDRDNAFGACKVVFDALRDCGLLWDDRPEFLESHVEQAQCPHKERHTIIEAEVAT